MRTLFPGESVTLIPLNLLLLAYLARQYPSPELLIAWSTLLATIPSAYGSTFYTKPISEVEHVCDVGHPVKTFELEVGSWLTFPDGRSDGQPKPVARGRTKSNASTSAFKSASRLSNLPTPGTATESASSFTTAAFQSRSKLAISPTWTASILPANPAWQTLTSAVLSRFRNHSWLASATQCSSTASPRDTTDLSRARIPVLPWP